MATSSEPLWRWYIVGPGTLNQRLHDVETIPTVRWPIEIKLPRLVIRIQPSMRGVNEEMQIFIREDLVDE